ncbi:MAG: hypothetical protein QXX03_05720 [Nitrososphaerota archaeon]
MKIDWKWISIVSLLWSIFLAVSTCYVQKTIEFTRIEDAVNTINYSLKEIKEDFKELSSRSENQFNELRTQINNLNGRISKIEGALEEQQRTLASMKKNMNLR